MKVSTREEDLAKELYEHDMGIHQGESVPWNRQIEKVQDSYRRQAVKVVNSKWFKQELHVARVWGGYNEAVARDEANTDNR